MERNTTTTIEQLAIGDRFYKAKDRTKTVLTKVEHETKVTKYQTYTQWAKNDTEKYPQPMKSDTAVIFLRHGQTEPATNE